MISKTLGISQNVAVSFDNVPISEGKHSDCYIPLNSSVQLDSLVVVQLCFGG